MHLQLDQQTRRLIEEISAISGISKDVVREVWEFTFIRWVEQISTEPHKLHSLSVPFLGSLGVRYNRDIIKEDGTMDIDVDVFVSLSDSCKEIIGDIADRKQNVLTDLIQNKINRLLKDTFNNDKA